MARNRLILPILAMLSALGGCDDPPADPEAHAKLASRHCEAIVRLLAKNQGGAKVQKVTTWTVREIRNVTVAYAMDITDPDRPDRGSVHMNDIAQCRYQLPPVGQAEPLGALSISLRGGDLSPKEIERLTSAIKYFQ